MDDRTYLREVQYRDDANLTARLELHRRFSVNRGDFQRWEFDQLDLPPRALVLEVGCGPGLLWAANLDRVPVGWEVVLTDLSSGMVEIARGRLGAGAFQYAVAEAEALPHPAAAFDAAIANHMLYHVADRPRAIRELARVLRPGGALFAVTNGRGHMRELDDLRARSGGAGFHRDSARFGLENGASQLREAFAEVELRRWEDALVITEPEPVVAYIRSMPAGEDVDCEAVRWEAAAAIERDGALRVGKATGIFIARSPIQSRT